MADEKGDFTWKLSDSVKNLWGGYLEEMMASVETSHSMILVLKKIGCEFKFYLLFKIQLICINMLKNWI